MHITIPAHATRLAVAQRAMVWLGTLALLGAWGCSDTNLRLEMPRQGDVVSAFPSEDFALYKEQEAPVPEGVGVTSAEPTGVISQVSAINVAFSKPMAEVDGVKELGDKGPFTLDPPLEGTFRWLGPQTASFVPSGPVPMATKFIVTVPDKLKALDGSELEHSFTFSFETPSLRLVRFDPSWYKAALRPDDKLFLQFNLPVTKEALQKALALSGTYGGVTNPVGFTLEETAKDRGDDAIKRGTGFFVTPHGGFQSGYTYTVAINKTLRTSEGPLGLGDAWTHTFGTYGPFAVRSVECYGTCSPTTSWSLDFTNPVDPKTIEKCISVTPPMKFEGVYGYTNRVTLQPSKPKPGTAYTINFSARCTDLLGNKLGKTGGRVVNVGHYPTYVKLDGGMNFMEVPAAGGDVKFPVTLRNTKDTQLKMVRINFEDLSTFAKHYQSWEERVFEHLKPQVSRAYGAKLALDEVKTFGVDLREVMGKDDTGVVYLNVTSQGSLTGNSYSYDRQALIQVTDIGLTAKYSPESILAWTTSLSTTAPIKGTEVLMLDPEGKTLWTGKTDANGLVTGPGLKAFGEVKPRLLVARRGKDMTFIDLESWDMQILPYRFGMDYEWDAPAAAIRGHVFTERGVYRPGESVHIKGYVRMDKGRKLEKVPVKEMSVSVIDARGESIASTNVPLSELGSFSVDQAIAANAPLGTYSIEVQPVGLEDPGLETQARGSFRVEAYRAPDFEVTVSPERPHVTVGDKLSANVNAQYLFGAPMSAARVSWSATRRETNFTPRGFEGFEFGSWENYYWWTERYLETTHVASGDGQLDPTGALPIELDLPVTESPRPEVVNIEAEVTDLNGQVITGRGQANLHPSDFYIGLKRNDYLVETNKPFDLQVIAVAPDGEPVVKRAVKVELKRRVWTSVRKKGAGGGYTWVTETSDEVRGSCAIKTEATPVPCKLDVPSSGYYVIEATAQDSKKRKVLSTSSLYAWGGDSYWWGRSDDERVELIVDKASYSVGDTARVMVKSPFETARALVTVERRGVISQWTQELKGATSTVEVPITEEMLPNAYVSVVLVRGRIDVPAGKTDVVDPGKPSYKIGYGSINVDKSGQALRVAIEAAEPSYRPGDQVEANIVVTDAAGNPASGEVTFMAVDEGVLSLTGYKTPNPLEALYRRQPLAVITTENRMGIVARVDTADEDGEKGDEGGDGFEGGESTNYRAAFATTAAFMPAVQVGADGHAKVDFKLPDNLTAYRLMAVAVSTGNRFGSADTRVQVRKPLMVRPALPRFLSTGDTLALRAVVQNVTDSPMKVHVAIEAEGAVALTGATAMDVDLAAKGLQEVRFPATIGAPGEATVKFRVEGRAGEELAKDAVSMTLPVKYPAVMRQHSETGVVRAVDRTNRVWRRIALPEGIRPDVGGLDIEVSSTAMAELLPGLHYLIGYPYGCVEQTTGRTLPLVALNELLQGVELPGIPAGNVQKFAQSGVDPDRLERLWEYLRQVLHDEASSPNWWSDYAMDAVKPLAAYTLAVAGELDPADLESLYQNRGLMPAFGKALLAMAVSELGGDRAQIDKLVTEMLIGVKVDGATAHLPGERNEWDWMFMNTDTRGDAIALMALQDARPDDPLVAKFARGLLDARRGGHWQNTQDNAFAVMSLATYYATTEKAIPDFSALVGIGDQVLGQETFRGRTFAPRLIHIPMQTLVENKGEVLSLARSGNSGALHYTMTLHFVEANPPRNTYDNGFTLMREYLAADGPNKDKPIQKVKVGDVVKIRLTLVSPTERRYVAVEDPLPAGLEPINTSFETSSRRLGEEVEQENNSRDDDDWWGWWYPGYQFDHIEQRDDRILLFADVLNDGVFDHVYLARATTPGTFAAPGARVEEMYSPEVYGRTQATTLVVEP